MQPHSIGLPGVGTAPDRIAYALRRAYVQRLNSNPSGGGVDWPIVKAAN